MCIIVICWPPLRTATPSEPVACKPFANGDIFNSPTAFRFAKSSGSRPVCLAKTAPRQSCRCGAGAAAHVGGDPAVRLIGGCFDQQMPVASVITLCFLHFGRRVVRDVDVAAADRARTLSWNGGPDHPLRPRASHQHRRVASAMKGRCVNLGGNLPKRG